jgi:hypothetical protein
VRWVTNHPKQRIARRRAEDERDNTPFSSASDDEVGGNWARDPQRAGVSYQTTIARRRAEEE